VRQLPTGTVTTLFTDIEGSTRLLQELGRDCYLDHLRLHRELLREAFVQQGGVEVEMQGDSFHFSFASASGAVRASADAQRALAEATWPHGEPIRIRVGLHTGEPGAADGLYVGLDIHRAARVMAAAHGGQVLLSETTAALVRDELPPELALRDLGQHRLKDLSAPQRIYQVVIEGVANDFAPPRTLENRPTNLPVQPTPLIGREHELAEALQLLRRPDVRLVTFTGAGGSGKTRLALQVAAEAVDNYPDGVYLVTLAPLTDPTVVVPTIAQTVGARERPGESLQQTLTEFVRSRRLLLVLDNFEHVSDAAPVLAELLAGAPDLELLVTSRSPIHISAEHEYPVRPLASDEAVLLFADRAQAAKPTFALNGNRSVVVEICRRLDNLPLAIELAAARIKLLPEKTLLERLERRLQLLTGGARDLPERQQTLRAAIEWSYSLLSDDERTLLRRFAVFVGGARLDAIESVCAVGQDVDILDGLGSLVDKSLVRQDVDGSGDARFGMLETIREYALEQLESAGEADSTAAAHAAHFDDLARRGFEPFRGAAFDPAFLVWAESEQSNLQSALAWAVSAEETDLAIRICLALSYLWYHRMMPTEVRQWSEPVLALPPGHDARARWQLLSTTGEILGSIGDLGRAQTLLAEAAAMAAELGDSRLIASSRTYLGHLAIFRGDHELGRTLYAQAAELNDSSGASAADRAIDRLNLGWALALEHDLEPAEHVLLEGLEYARRAHSRMLEGGVLVNLGGVALEKGDFDRAEQCLREGLTASADVGEFRMVADSFGQLARAAAGRGEYDRAAVLTGVSEGLFARAGGVFSMVPRADLEAVAMRAMGEELWRERVARGRELSLDDALHYALEPHAPQ
jgi:predicted ATPase/class 3 adenylate cyclase